jgi:hypothetical protein
MALVNGPLFSLDASGAVGKAIVFTKWKGRNVVREYVSPANPKTIAQQASRVMMRAINLLWHSADSTDRESWVADAAARNISPFNALAGENLRRQQIGLWPTKNLAVPGTTVSAVAEDVTSEIMGDSVVMAIETLSNISTAHLIWYTVQLASAGNGESVMNVVGVLQGDGTDDPREISFPKPASGTYVTRTTITDMYGNRGPWVTGAGLVIP